MSQHIALFRGINVGKAKRIAMADLRALLESLGYTGVRTLLNSGNAVFHAPDATPEALSRRIHDAVKTSLGVDAHVIVKTAREMAASVEENALRDVAANPSRLLVAYTASAGALGEFKPLTKSDWSPGALHLGNHAAYLWCPDGILESALNVAVGRALGDRVTTRNWATVEKIHALLDS